MAEARNYDEEHCAGRILSDGWASSLPRHIEAVANQSERMISTPAVDPGYDWRGKAAVVASYRVRLVLHLMADR